MSLTASLTQELGQLRAAAERTANATEQGGEKMTRAMRRTANEAKQVNRNLTEMQKKIQMAGSGALAAFGIGSVTMAATSAVRLIQRLMADAEKRSIENRDAATGFAEGVRNPGVADQGGFQSALRSGGVGLTEAQLIAVGKAIAGQGVSDPAMVRAIAAASAAQQVRAVGMDPSALAGAIALAARMGSDRPGDLVGSMLTRTSGDISEAMKIIAAMTPMQMRRQATDGGFTGFFGGINPSDLSRSQVRIEQVGAIAGRPDEQGGFDRNEKERISALRKLSTSQDIIAAVVSGAGSLDELTLRQLNQIITNVDDSGSIRFGSRISTRPAATRQALTEQAEQAIQRVQLVGGTEVIGDDQP